MRAEHDRMRHSVIAAVLALALSGQLSGQRGAGSPPPDTEIFLAPLSTSAGLPSIGQPVNITNSPGYDNQPSFTPDGQQILFTSNRGGTQTDIFRYDIAGRAIARGIGRSIQKIPGRATISFVEREVPAVRGGAPILRIRELEPKGRHITPLVNAVAGASEADCAWTPDGMLLMAHTDMLYGWKRGEPEWRRLADLAPLGLHGVTRLAVSPKDDRIAFVTQQVTLARQP